MNIALRRIFAVGLLAGGFFLMLSSIAVFLSPGDGASLQVLIILTSFTAGMAAWWLGCRIAIPRDR